ncbi:two-component system sensor histidine kinase/response regulator [Halorubrum persicum]|uniref:histidine kinase n=1 Tax=Halorubrum persicum TaxID=1383844 RepID=A0A2G1WLK9_9EURY|nr:PAS domain-containing protein [Halorubrum persicum]PHQ39843.1 two-component system sensor histidine kinase/response regulator [Halorubrum persicum]
MNDSQEEAVGVLLDALPDLFFAVGEDGTMELWNDAVPEVTGYDEAALRRMTPAEFVPTADDDRVTETIAEALEAGAGTIEAELTTATGERIPYQFSLRPAPDESALAFVGIGRDIAVRKRAERDRDGILNRMRDGFFAVDDEWRITYANEKGEQLLSRAMNRPRETTLEGLHLWEEIPDAVETTFYREYNRAMETGEPVSFEEYFPPLEDWFEVRAFPDDTGLSIYFREITEEQRYRDRLEHREQVLKELHDITADRDASFAEQVQRLLVLGRAEFGTEFGSLSEIVGDKYQFEVVDADDDTIQAGDVVPLEATNCERVASRRETIAWGDVARDAPEETDRAGYTDWGISCYLGGPVYDNDGVYGTFCFYGTDTRADRFSEWEVTLVDLMSRWVSYELQREQITEKLQRQNDRLEQFASIVSHDLRGPLNVLRGRLELAEETGDPSDLAGCFDAVERMEALIDDVLSLSKAGDAIDDIELIGLRECATLAWDAAPTETASLELAADATVPADASRLQQLLENLFRNSVEHGSTGNRTSSGDSVEHGGEDVTVTVGRLEDGFYVEDDGPGIPESERGDVFDSGYTTTADGTGFGLAIVADIADAHGWTLRVAEAESGGARFELTNVGVRDGAADGQRAE